MTKKKKITQDVKKINKKRMDNHVSKIYRGENKKSKPTKEKNG